jgi:uncharacterized protein YndB with AHSA1/START domain
VSNDDRRFEMSIDIAAPPKDVWDALTKAEELVRWFPLDAEVTPGAGGSIKMGWGEAWSGIMRIDAWEPQRLLRLVDENARPYDVNGQPLADGQTAPSRVVLEFTLETAQGGTRLRVVHSGFGRGAAWDDEIEGVSTGWQFELRGLNHYLTRHRGRDRVVAHVQGASPLGSDALWAALVGDDVIKVTAPNLSAGQPFSADLGDGDRLSGEILLSIPGREFAGIASELGDGIFRICVFPAGGQTGYMVLATSYRGDADRLKAMERRLAERVVKRLSVNV